MDIALAASRNGIEAQVQSQDLIAHNLANITTTGFKKSRQVLSTFPVPGTFTSATPQDFSQGDLYPTGQELDLAIDGDGFFTVLKGGIPAYTRSGNFHRDRDGNLVTPQGHLLEPSITLPPETERVEIASDGTVFAITDGGTAAQEAGKIEVVRFQNPMGLVPIGDSLYAEGPDSGPALTGSFGEDGFPSLRQRFLEQSNVELSEEITQEIVTQRAFQANMRAFRTTDQIIGDTLDLFR